MISTVLLPGTIGTGDSTFRIVRPLLELTATSAGGMRLDLVADHVIDAGPERYAGRFLRSARIALSSTSCSLASASMAAWRSACVLLGAVQIDQFERDLFPIAALGAEVADAIGEHLIFAHDLVIAVLEIEATGGAEGGHGQGNQNGETE